MTETIDISALCNSPAPADWNEHRPRLESDVTYRACYEKYQAKYLDEPWCNGRLPIVEYGCGEWFFLLVRGPARGTAWVDALNSCSGLFNLRVDFATFYHRWLIDPSSRLKAHNFSPGGGSSEFGNS